MLQPITIVLPHHNLVQSTRLDFLRHVASRRLFTSQIILIGPDHFSPNQRQIITSDIDWYLSTGIFHFKKIVDLPVDNPTLKNDHAIFNPLSDLKKFFPHASVQPILIGQKVPVSDLDNLFSQIESSCNLDCLLVFSVDFSHYLPASLAHLHDIYTLTRLNNIDPSGLLTAEVDSPQSLYLMAKYASNRHAKRWHLFAHTNSGIISGNPDIETTTHVFGSYSFGPPQPKGSNFVKTISPVEFDRSYGVDELVVNPASQFVVTTLNDKFKSILPIKDGLFVRGPEKQEIIKNYLDSLTSDNVTKDYFWGTLIYE